MSVIRVDNYFDAYRLRSQSEDIHELAARGDNQRSADFVNRRILELLQPERSDFLVDIGCGDGSLLRMLGNIAPSVGIVGSTEEQQRLQSTYPSLFFKAGDMRALPLESHVASKIVCNAALFYLPSDSAVRAALSEIRRIARLGSVIWLGEIPEVDEYKYFGNYRGHSMLAFLGHLLRHNGPRAFLGMIHRWARAMLGKEQIVLNSAGIFHAKPDQLVDMAESCGLVLKTYFRHKEIDLEGNVVDSPFRYDYLFTV